MERKHNRNRVTRAFNIVTAAAAVALSTQQARADGEFSLSVGTGFTWEIAPWSIGNDTGAQIFPGDATGNGAETVLLNYDNFGSGDRPGTISASAGWNYALGSLTVAQVGTSGNSRTLLLSALNPGTILTNIITLTPFDGSGNGQRVSLSTNANIAVSSKNGGADVLNITNDMAANGRTITINGPVKSGGIVFNGPGALTLAGAVSGTGGVQHNGTGGDLIISGTNNSFTGNVNVTGGVILQINSDAGLGNAANDINLSNNSKLNVGGQIALGAGRVINIGAGGAHLRPFAPNSLTLPSAGQLTGAGDLTKDFGGNVIIAAANTGFTGNVFVGAAGSTGGGILDIRDANALGNTAGTVGTITVGGAAGDRFVFSPNYANYNANPARELGRITADSNGILALGQNTSSPLDFTSTPNLSLAATSTSFVVDANTPGATVSGVITPGANGYSFGGGTGGFGIVADNIPAGTTLPNGRLIINTPLAGVGTQLTQKVYGLTQLNQPNTYTGPTVIDGGTLYLNHPGAAALSSGITVSGNSAVTLGATNVGALLLNPNTVYLGGGTNITWNNGAIGWAGDKVITSLPAPLSPNTIAGTMGVPSVKFLHLGGPNSSGVMTQNGAFAFSDDAGTPVQLIKSGANSTLDLTNAPAGGNTFTGGLDVAGGAVLFSATNQLGAGGRVGGSYGVLKLKPGAGNFDMGNVTLESTGGQGFNNQIGFGIDVSAGDTLRVNNAWEVGSNNRNAFIKLGAGALAYLPPSLVGESGTSHTYGLNIKEGTVRINQMPYRSGNNQPTGLLEFRGNGTLIVEPAPGDITTLPSFANNAYGFQQLSVFNGASARIEIAADTLFRTSGRSNQSYTFITDGSTLTVAGAGATNGSRFQLGRSTTGNFVNPVGQGGTLDLQKVAFSLFAATSGNDFWPADPKFTLKLNDTALSTPYVSIPGNLTHNGNFIINDQPSASLSTWDNFNLAGTGNTAFRGTLEKVGAGTVNISRTGGAVNVAPGATLLISDGTLVAGGTADPFTDTLAGPPRHVAVQNQAVFQIAAGHKHVAALVNSSTNSLSGQTTVLPGATLRTGRLIQSDVTIGGSATSAAAIHIDNAPQPGQLNNKVATLSIPQDAGVTTGTLDLGNTNLLIDYPQGNSPLATVKDLLRQGYAGGAWNGPGINASAAAANPKRAIGYGEAATVLGINESDPGIFLGDNIDGSTLILRYTVTGDTNLDGGVGFVDLLRVAANFGQLEGSAVWTDGDLNYDGSITFVDLLAVAANFGGALPSSADLAGLSGDQQALIAAAFAAVPEPGALALVGMGVALAGRRRRS